MIGPVLFLELQQAGRRGRLLKLWHGYAAWLALQLLVLYTSYSVEVEVRRHPSRGRPVLGTAGLTGRFVNSYLETFVTQHFALLLLATPTFVAGAITDEKTRGTLQFLFCADVSSWEIVAGKLLGRLAQVAFVTSAGLPFVCFIGGFGGLDAPTLVGLAGVTAGPLFGLGAASILSSVWNKETRDAVFRVYFCLMAVVVALLWFRGLGAALSVTSAPAGSVSAWALGLLLQANEATACLNPIYVLEPSWQYHDQVTMLGRLGLALLTWGGVGVVCITLAVWRLRPAHIRQLQGRPRRHSLGRGARRHGPVGDDPIAWKEREFGRTTMLPMLRFAPAVVLYVALAAATIWVYRTFEWSAAGFAWFVPFVLVSLVALRASGVVCRERDQRTWDLVLLTPLDTSEILYSKHRGVLQSVYPYAIVYFLSVVVVAIGGSLGLGILATVLLGVGWAGMYYMGALGILWSVRSRSPWKSLLATLATGYAALLFLYFSSSVLTCGLGACVSTTLLAGHPRRAGSELPAAIAVALVVGSNAAVLYYFLRRWARVCFISAESWVNKHERVWLYHSGGWHTVLRPRPVPFLKDSP